MVLDRRFILGAIVIAVVPVVGVALWLLSPLLFDKEVQEEFPLAFTAELPDDMTMAEVEQVMESMAKVDGQVGESMDDAMKMMGEVAAGQPVILKSGSFRDADSFHTGSGSATVYRGEDGTLLLRLEDFRVTNGPDLRVILSPHADPMGRGDVTAAGYVELGKLKGNVGNQNYPIPEGTDVSSLNSVVIYCKPFHVLFSVAPLGESG